MPAASLHRLVVAYDDTDGANAAAGFGLLLAALAGAHVTIAHACPGLEAAGAHAGALAELSEQLSASETEWARRLDAVRSYAVADARVQSRLLHGQAAGAIIDLAREIEADAVLAGSHEPDGLRSALVPTTSFQLLEHAPCPVMLFPGGAGPLAHPHAVVVGIDGSPGSGHALALAQRLAAPLGAELMLVHVVDPHIPFVGDPSDTLRAELHGAAGALLHAARASVAAPLDVVREEIVEGEPSRGLTEVCDRHAPAVLVVGSRGIGGFRGLLLGSTSRRVVHHAVCPVLIARSAPA